MISLDTKAWLVEWFAKNTNLSKKDIQANAGESYFEKGWIDSFKFISLVSDIENTFKIAFTNEDFQNREFSTINGLIGVINGRLKTNPKL